MNIMNLIISVIAVQVLSLVYATDDVSSSETCLSSTAGFDPKFNPTALSGTNYRNLGMFAAIPDGKTFPPPNLFLPEGNRTDCYKMTLTFDAANNLVILTQLDSAGVITIQLNSGNTGYGKVIHPGSKEEESVASFPVASEGALAFSSCEEVSNGKEEKFNVDYVQYYVQDGTEPAKAFLYLNQTLVDMGYKTGFYVPWCRDGLPPKTAAE